MNLRHAQIQNTKATKALQFHSFDQEFPSSFTGTKAVAGLPADQPSLPLHQEKTGDAHERIEELAQIGSQKQLGYLAVKALKPLLYALNFDLVWDLWMCRETVLWPQESHAHVV